MRRALSLLGVVLAIPVLLAVPVVTCPAVSPTPVKPRLAAVDFRPLPSVRGVVATVPPQRTRHVTLVGAAWHGSPLARGTTIELRTHDHGSWSPWTALSLPDEGPDDNSIDARSAAARHVRASDPIWVGSADGVQARLVAAGARPVTTPADLHLVLVDGGSSGADASPGAPRALGGDVADAAETQPTIYTRAQWGADERLRSRNSGCSKIDYGSTIKMGFLHHTDGANGYSSGQVPSIIRSIYAYHVESNGWCDIGYNYLVDRFGRIWEGRYGGITRPVIGAHTGGFNTDSFGVSMIGNFTSSSPSSAMLAGVEKLFAWRLGGAYADPLGKTQMHAASFSGSRYRAGSTVTFNVVSGHRDADTTTCPGSAAYAKMSSIRAAIAKLMGAGFVTPALSAPSLRMLSGQTVTLHAGVLDDQTWTATVTDSAGTTVKTLTGSATRSAPVAATWDGTALDGTPVPPGVYTMTLTGADAAGAANIPFTTPVTVTPPVTVNGPATVAYNASVPLSGTAAPNTAVTVTLQPAAQGSSPDVRAITSDANGAWSTTFAAADDYTWTVSAQGWSAPSGTTMVTPALTSPAPTSDGLVFIPAGRTLSLAGTAKPGTTVTPVVTPAGGAPASLAPVTADSNGAWSGVSLTATAPTKVVLQRSTSIAAAPVTVYPVGAITGAAPASGYAGRTVTVSGSAGGAPLSVQLFTRAAGAASYTLTRTVAAAPAGTFTVPLTLPPTATPTSVDWQIVAVGGGTTFGTTAGATSVQPVFAPTASAVTAAFYRQTVAVGGRAVPGDTVVLWTRPATGGSWTRTASVAATSTSSYALRFTLRRDTTWRVTTPTGATPARTVFVRPTLRGATHAAHNAMLTFSGTAIAGDRVRLYRRAAGTSRWRLVGTVPVSASGSWSGHFRLVYPTMNIVARLHNQLSTVLTVHTS